MKITIIGWYGTETIGDRAILAGLLSFFQKAFDDFEVAIGSLYPFFTERSINEDYSLYKKIIRRDVVIAIFNSRIPKELLRMIKGSDILVMGGGPLMDLNELFMVEYAFKKAQKYNIKTMILGSGIGPLFYKKYRKSVLEITRNSDTIILRDTKSKINLERIYSEFNRNIDDLKIYTSFDPSVECALNFNTWNTKKYKNHVAINLRAFPPEYSRNIHPSTINNALMQIIKTLSEVYHENEIKLIPMHYFHVGGDDREILNHIALSLKRNNINVQNSNLSLMETIDVYANAYFNVGMRFHSVILQTITSGKNYVLDYTEPNTGKISGFLFDIDCDGFYSDRYLSLQDEEITANMITNIKEQFSYDRKYINSRLKIYVKKLNEFK